MRVELSVVVPVYRCGHCLDDLYRRATDALATQMSEHELVFVNDASPDDSARILARLSEHDPRITVVSMPRNAGQHAAIAAGIARARGQWVAVMDGDLQDPPEILPQFAGRGPPRSRHRCRKTARPSSVSMAALDRTALCRACPPPPRQPARREPQPLQRAFAPSRGRLPSARGAWPCLPAGPRKPEPARRER